VAIAAAVVEAAMMIGLVWFGFGLEIGCSFDWAVKAWVCPCKRKNILFQICLNINLL